MAWPTHSNPGTRHLATCSRVFSRYDLTCPRCVELSKGGAARPGWSDNKRRCEVVISAGIQAHFAAGGPHDRGLCGPVCTFGDW